MLYNNIIIVYLILITGLHQIVLHAMLLTICDFNFWPEHWDIQNLNKI